MKSQEYLHSSLFVHLPATWVTFVASALTLRDMFSSTDVMTDFTIMILRLLNTVTALEGNGTHLQLLIGLILHEKSGILWEP